MRFVIVDIDHTISDAAWRDGLLGQWDRYYIEGLDDKPIEFTVNLIRLLHYAGQHRIIAVTARPEDVRPLTYRWFMRHDVPIDTVLMREQDDHRPSSEVKRELVERHFQDLSLIDFVIEDRDDCVAMYKQLGLNVLQVNCVPRGEAHGKTSQDGEDPDGEREDDRWRA